MSRWWLCRACNVKWYGPPECWCCGGMGVAAHVPHTPEAQEVREVRQCRT